jgi:hypothetical protein
MVNCQRWYFTRLFLRNLLTNIKVINAITNKINIKSITMATPSTFPIRNRTFLLLETHTIHDMTIEKKV